MTASFDLAETRRPFRSRTSVPRTGTKRSLPVDVSSRRARKVKALALFFGALPWTFGITYSSDSSSTWVPGKAEAWVVSARVSAQGDAPFPQAAEKSC